MPLIDADTNIGIDRDLLGERQEKGGRDRHLRIGQEAEELEEEIDPEMTEFYLFIFFILIILIIF
jgi:hypothetical protein